EFKASNGWLNRFRIRHKIEFKASNDSLSIRKERDTEWTSKIRKIMQGFALGDVFNAVKTVLFYLAIPEKKCFDETNSVGVKVAEKFLTIFLCASMTGEKLKPLVVWEGSNPQCLKGVTKRSLGVSWKCVSKLWMTTDIVTDWLRELDQEMKFQERKILLFIDNATSHPHINLENIQLVFFPSNLTSASQPLNHGVIQNFKVKYRQLLLNHLIANLDYNPSAQELSKSIDVLRAIGWIKNALRAVLPEIIRNSFTATGFPNDGNKDVVTLKSVEEDTALPSQLIELLQMDMDATEYSQIDEILAGRNHIWESQTLEEAEDALGCKVKREASAENKALNAFLALAFVSISLAAFQAEVTTDFGIPANLAAWNPWDLGQAPGKIALLSGCVLLRTSFPLEWILKTKYLRLTNAILSAIFKEKPAIAVQDNMSEGTTQEPQDYGEQVHHHYLESYPTDHLQNEKKEEIAGSIFHPSSRIKSYVLPKILSPETKLYVMIVALHKMEMQGVAVSLGKEHHAHTIPIKRKEMCNTQQIN
ncbi:hypothetical protein J437_LFUL010859, partial [Ladona fulva]